MSDDKNSVSVSFTHISEDVVVPSDPLKQEKGIRFFKAFFYTFDTLSKKPDK